MNHPDWIKKTNDAEYMRRYNRLFFMHALSLLPLFVFVLVLWLEGGDVKPSAVYLSGASYLLGLLLLRGLWRRDVLSGMRREGMIDRGYRPPML
ncbi:hypothetical protein R0135_04710 [Congregibacter variabilis]|uniref:Uncharacterized protein n=1 Tax=Congregibacter variabilis TaxID=3081200 RepID=A0ABZ0I5N1_9GAMM|nr:hypothetical protein R0135_04710 [Congregibacter sp. IMCC43200]